MVNVVLVWYQNVEICRMSVCKYVGKMYKHFDSVPLSQSRALSSFASNVVKGTLNNAEGSIERSFLLIST